MAIAAVGTVCLALESGLVRYPTATMTPSFHELITTHSVSSSFSSCKSTQTMSACPCGVALSFATFPCLHRVSPLRYAAMFLQSPSTTQPYYCRSGSLFYCKALASALEAV